MGHPRLQAAMIYRQSAEKARPIIINLAFAMVPAVPRFARNYSFFNSQALVHTRVNCPFTINLLLHR